MKINNISNKTLSIIYDIILMAIILNIINTNNTVVTIFLVYLYLLIKLHFIVIIIPILYIAFVIKSRNFDIVKIIKTTIIFRTIIFITCLSFNYVDIDSSYIYILLYVLIISSFTMSKKKLEWIMKLFFILSFWSLVYVVTDLIAPNFNIYIFMSSFSIYYFLFNDMVYFDIDPDDLSKIHAIMHDLLKNLDLNFLEGDQIPPDGPALPYYFDSDEEDNPSTRERYHVNKIPNSILKYKDLFIPIKFTGFNIYSHCTTYKHIADEDAISAPRLNFISKLIDAHNKKVTCIQKQDFSQNLHNINKSLSRNLYLDYTITYYLKNYEKFSSHYQDQTTVFIRILKDIYQNVHSYNSLMGAKFYYENTKSTNITGNNEILIKNLPEELKNMWKNCHANILQDTIGEGLTQALNMGEEDEDPIEFILNRDWYNIIADTTKEETVYKKLWQEIIRTGVSILCQVYTYEKLVTNFTNGSIDHPILVSEEEFLNKGWDYYEESISKYHMFFDLYHWNSKIELLKNNSINRVIAFGNNNDFITIKDRGYNYQISSTHNLSFDERNSSMERFLVNTKELLKNKSFKDKNFKDKISSLKSKTSKLVSKLK